MKFEDWLTKIDFGGDMWADIRKAHELVMSLESQLKERDEALIEMHELLSRIKMEPLDDKTPKRFIHSLKAWRSSVCEAVFIKANKHQSLINQIKESRK